MSTTSTIRSEIVAQFVQVAEEHGNTLAPLTDDLELLDSGLDSLSVAVVVARLDSQLGIDPFSSSEETLFPVTFGDFVRLYENATK
jgi:acyl carrier protein